MSEKKPKQFRIDMTREQHAFIKARAAYLNMSMAQYFMQAVDEMVQREKQYE